MSWRSAEGEKKTQKTPQLHKVWIIRSCTAKVTESCCLCCLFACRCACASCVHMPVCLSCWPAAWLSIPEVPPPLLVLDYALNSIWMQSRSAVLSVCVYPDVSLLRVRLFEIDVCAPNGRCAHAGCSHLLHLTEWHSQSVRQTLGQTRAATHGSSCSRLPVDGNPLGSQSDRRCLCTCAVSSFLDQTSMSWMSFIWYLSVFSIPTHSKTVGAPMSQMQRSALLIVLNWKMGHNDWHFFSLLFIDFIDQIMKQMIEKLIDGRGSN